MEVLSLKAYFNSINYDYSIFKDNINTINKLTKTRSKGNNKPLDATAKQIMDVLSNNEENIEQFGLEQPFLIHAICKKYNAKNFLEIGVFCGVTAKNVCKFLREINGDDFKYIGIDLFGGEKMSNNDEIEPKFLIFWR